LGKAFEHELFARSSAWDISLYEAMQYNDS